MGKFDGLHLGHRRLLALARERARALDARLLAVTFDPLPEDYFRPGARRPLLPEPKRLALFGELGVAGVVLLPFNDALACQAPAGFARQVLSAALRCAAVFVGEDFCFGKDRAGRVPELEAFGRELGFSVHPVPLLSVDGEKVSSSRIRELLAQGKKREAATLLGGDVR